MRLSAVALGSLAWLLIGGGQPAEAAPPVSDAKPQTLAWRQNVFAIPFRVNRAPYHPESPREARLFVSDDFGKTWRLDQRVEPGVGNFMYRAPSDGTYWFSLRTVNRSGQLLPAGPHQGDLKVTVDTIAPQLTLSGQQGPAGEIQLRWESEDAHLMPGSLKIEYQSQANGPWQALALPPGTAQGTAQQRQGTASMWPEQGTRSVLFRAQIDDRAGNQTVSQAQVALRAQPAMAAAQQDAVGWRAGAPATESPVTPALPDTTPAVVAARSAWLPDQVAQQPLLTDMANQAPAVGQPPQSQSPGSFVSMSRSLTTSEPAGASPLAPPTQQPINSGKPPVPGQNVSLVNSHTFDLQYEIKAPAASEVSSVELWATLDRGRSWRNEGFDADRQSPFRVRVDQDGTYGYRIVIRNASGFRGWPPNSGVPPEQWIVVDTVRPQLTLLGVTAQAPGAGQGGSHLIRWEARDQQIDPRGISLYYAARPGDPGILIASRLENTGSYQWQPSGELPSRVYLRLEARDRAGNVSSVETPRPVVVRPPMPTGHIHGAQPVGSQARRTLGSYF